MKDKTILKILAVVLTVTTILLIHEFRLPLWETICVFGVGSLAYECIRFAYSRPSVLIRITKKDIVKAIARNNHGNITKS